MNTAHPFRALAVSLLLAAACVPLASAKQPAAKLSVVPEQADGVFGIGQTILWKIEAAGFGPSTTGAYTIKRGGRTVVDSGPLTLVDGRAEVDAVLDEPGALLLEVNFKSPDGKELEAFGGAIVAPELIAPSADRPADFDAFWKAQVARLADVPPNAELTPADSGQPGVDYWKITLDNVDGTHVQGQLARPAKGDKLPALLIPQWAGVYPLEKPWATGPAAEGWLVLNILAHDLPIDKPAKYYADQYAGPLENYWAIGNDDRDKSYFVRMFLSCYQATEYLTQRPDWDGRTLVVMGTSQGGWQTLAIAGLDPRFTAALALVPAGCDMLGPDAGRRDGWPQWYDQTAGKDAARVHETSRYFDAVNFASRIKCPTLVGLGLVDNVCPPEGIMAAVNEIDAPTEVVILPLSAHQEVDGSQQPYYKRSNGAWLPALRVGKPAPVDAP